MNERQRTVLDLVLHGLEKDGWQEAADALTILSDQLAAKTELATLYAASLRQSEAEVEGLKADAERYRWLRNLTRGQQTFGGVSTGSSPSMQWFKFPPISPVSNIMRGAVSQHLDEAIDAARSKSEEVKP